MWWLNLNFLIPPKNIKTGYMHKRSGRDWKWFSKWRFG